MKEACGNAELPQQEPALEHHSSFGFHLQDGQTTLQKALSLQRHDSLGFFNHVAGQEYNGSNELCPATSVPVASID